MSQKFEELKTLLRELFQIDQPDLDFGLYRVLRAKSAEITTFLEEDLLTQVKGVLEGYADVDKKALRSKLEKVEGDLRGVKEDPSTNEIVIALKQQLQTEAMDLGQVESEIYNHLIVFFRRYYAEGDFLTRRAYDKETYAIPYDGSEVALHWANKDQYYIKSTERFSDFAFRLRPYDDANPLRVKFRLAEATEGAHNNAKEEAAKTRRFQLSDAPFAGIEDGKLVIHFVYEQHSGQQSSINEDIESRVIAITDSDASFEPWRKDLKERLSFSDGSKSKNSKFRVQLNRYTARNTSDYFIHKNLKAFLHRELNYYIKNEVMQLDNLESETAPRVEQYLSKIRLIRKIAGKIIDFLAQLENFQKKLWLKKKFVVETRYCITVGAIPEAFYAEIASNDAQREEWVKLLAIDEIKGDLSTPGYSAPLTQAFLKENPTLVLDTRNFAAAFVARLLEELGELDKQTDGVLFHGDSFHALRTAQKSIARSVRCIYIDPPYNTGSDNFVYKDGYRHSSWLSMMSDRLVLGERLLSPNGFFFGSIDDNEFRSFASLLESHMDGELLPTITWEKRTKAQNTKSARQMLQSKTEYILGLRTGNGPQRFKLEATGTKEYPLLDDQGTYRIDTIGQMAADGMRGRKTMVYPINEVSPRAGMQWKLGKDEVDRLEREGKVVLIDGAPSIVVRPEDEDESRYAPFWSHFFDKDVYGTAEIGSSEVRDDLGFGRVIETVKPTRLIQKLVSHCTDEPGAIVLDYFSGSGTTGHAVINLNRQDGCQRRFILVEMGEYFDTVLLPRIKKVVFAPEWKDGKPNRLATTEEATRSPRIVKVIRLESYEDTLNNLELTRSSDQQSLLDGVAAAGPDGFREQYLLRYMLEAESQNSASLLNAQSFTDPAAYKLRVKQAGSDEPQLATVDIIETFNWLIGLKVSKLAAGRSYAASFTGGGSDASALANWSVDQSGPFWFRYVMGTTPDDKSVLVIWRTLPHADDNSVEDALAQANLVLEGWFADTFTVEQRRAFGTVFVNGPCTLETLRGDGDPWIVFETAQRFHALMFSDDGV